MINSLLFLIVGIGIVPLFLHSVAATQLDILGDIGTNSVAKRNLAILAKQNECLLGVGDYSYTNSISSSMQKLYNEIECKVGVPGNHELEKNEGKAWAQKNFNYLANGYGSWILKPNIGVIGLNPYTDSAKGSTQYNFVSKQLDLFKANPTIDWIIIAMHPNFFTPTVEGGHGPAKAMRDTYLPLIEDKDLKERTILATGHNHITAFGKVQGWNVVVCGGGGKGGDSVGGTGKNSGFEFATSDQFGHCDMNLGRNIATVQLIGDDGTVKALSTFNKNNEGDEAPIIIVPQAN